MKTLAEIYKESIVGLWPDKGTDHSYIELYEHILSPYRLKAKRVLEIGILGGESLRMWERYFENASVHGADISMYPVGGMADLAGMIREGGHNIHIVDVTDKEKVNDEFGWMRFDVVIDDASHNLEDQIKMYHNLKPMLSKGALYIIEDVNNIDDVSDMFYRIDPEKKITIHDRRNIKGRFDDVIILIEDK